MKGVVFSKIYIFTRVMLCAALTNNDVTSDGGLATKNFYAQSFRFGFSSVFRATYSFFVCHGIFYLADNAAINSAFFKLVYPETPASLAIALSSVTVLLLKSVLGFAAAFLGAALAVSFFAVGLAFTASFSALPVGAAFFFTEVPMDSITISVRD